MKRNRYEKNRNLSKLYVKIFSIILLALLMIMGNYFYSIEKNNVGILANSGLSLSLVAKEVTVNEPFFIALKDTEVAKETGEISENKIDSLESGSINQVTKTVITLPIEIDFDEARTKQLSDGNDKIIISFDKTNRNLSIDWSKSNNKGELEISLVSKNAGTYELNAEKSINGELTKSEPLTIEVKEEPESVARTSDNEVDPVLSTEATRRVATFAAANEAIVSNVAELSAAIKNLTITNIYFSNDISLNQSIQIPNEKKYLRISGKNPTTGEIHSLTESGGTGGGTDNIYVSNNNSDPKDYGLNDMKIIGRNYYGPLNVQDNTREVTLSYMNVDYQGPQITHNVNGITKYLGTTSIYIARVQTTSAPNQEVAEARNVIIDGNITINHTSNSDSMFWLGLSGGSENSFTIKENSNVIIDSKGNGMFYRDGANAISMDIEKNAKVKITTNNGLFRNNPGKYLHVGENANVEFEKTGGDQPVLRLNEDLSVAKGARLSMKATGGSGNFARFESAYTGNNVNFDDPLSVLLYNKTSQQMFSWTGSGNSSGKMYFNAAVVNYWRVAGTGDRDDLPLFSWSMLDKSNIVTNLTTNGSNSTVINSTNSGMNATDFNLGTAKVISLGEIDVTIDSITDAQDTVTGTATRGAKVFIDYTEEGINKTLTGIAGEDGKYSIAIPKGFIKPYISVTATSNLDFRTRTSNPIIVKDVTPPEGTPVIQVFSKGDKFPKDITGFVKDIRDKSDTTSGAGVTVTAGKISEPDMNQFGPVLPMYEVVLTDKAGNTATIKVPIFIKDTDTEVSGTTALRAKDVTFRIPQYPQTDAELKAFIQEKADTEAWDLATGKSITDLSSLVVDISNMQEAIGSYPVTFKLGDVKKTIKVTVTPGVGTVNVHYQDEAGTKLADDKVIVDDIGNAYSEQPISLNGYEYLRTQGAASGVIEDQTQEVIFIYKQNRFKLSQSASNLDGGSADKVALTEKIKFKTQLTSQLAEKTPTVYYKNFTISIPIDAKLSDIEGFLLETDDGETKGTVVYDEITRLLTATVTEADQISWSENLTLNYQGTVRDDAVLASIISSKAEAAGDYTNSWVADTVESNTTKTEVIDGKLFFISAPTAIDFGDSLKIEPKEKNYPIQSMSGSLTVRDTRSVKASWTLTARMEKVLTSSANNSLPNALKYTSKGSQKDLGTDSITIYENTSINSNPVSISDAWIPNGDGLSVNVEPGQVYPEEYTGSITWTLQDTP